MEPPLVRNDRGTHRSIRVFVFVFVVDSLLHYFTVLVERMTVNGFGERIERIRGQRPHVLYCNMHIEAI